MIDTEVSSAKTQLEYLKESLIDVERSLCIFIVDWMLKIPIGLPYKTWKKLHLIKGDWE